MDLLFEMYCFQNVTTNVKNNLNAIERLQRQYASIELADRTAIERSYEMINFWSIIHLLVMLFSLSVQVLVEHFHGLKID